jgi:hypothetical protein
MANRHERFPSRVEAWVSERPEFTYLCHNNAHVYAVLQMADHENWPVERFLEQCVLILGQVNAGLSGELLRKHQLELPPIFVKTE